MTLSEFNNSNDGTSPGDTFKILLATDIHLGYNETDKIAGDDSFNTFEEILMLAVSRDVDFILLGGDLFHKAQPSSNSLNRCINLMRTYTLGDKEINFKLINMDENQELSVSCSMSSGVNFKDPNMNVSYPIFSIHGNHDDTVNNLSALDLLSSTGLVNYFGKWQSLQEVNLDPIILQKNRTKIALYGLSHIPDRRLYNLFNEKKVYISVPSSNQEEYFNILVLHQNRADRGAKNTISPEILPNNMNLVVWGHEHDCRIEPEPFDGKGEMYITQPGSSVATSLCVGEAIEKKVGILYVCFNRIKKIPVFRIQTIPLKTVRPFIFKSIELKNFDDELNQIKGNMRDKIEKFLEGEVEEMIKESQKLLSGHPKQPKLPLIRLRVLFEEVDSLLNIKRFGQKFIERTANAGDILLFKKNIQRLKTAKVEVDDKELDKAVSARNNKVDRVEDVVEKYFNSLSEEREKLKLINIKCLSEMCRFIIDKEDEAGGLLILDSQVNQAEIFLNTHMRHPDQSDEIVRQFREDKSLVTFEESVSNALAIKPISNTTIRPNYDDSDVDEADNVQHQSDDNEEEEESPNIKKPTRGRGSRGGRGGTSRGRVSKVSTSTTAAKTTTRGRQKKQPLMNIAQQLSMRPTQQSLFEDSD